MQNKEEKQQRFKRLASKRTNDVLNRLRVLSNCANKNTYSYTSEEVHKIFNTIDRAAKESKSKFKINTNKEFKL